jgi:hypothetical protein
VNRHRYAAYADEQVRADHLELAGVSWLAPITDSDIALLLIDLDVTPVGLFVAIYSS